MSQLQPLYQSRFGAYHSQQGNYVNYALQMIMFIISQTGPREPGSIAERKAADIFMDDLRNYQLPNNRTSVTREEFIVHPHAFMSWVVIDCFLMIIAVFCYNFKMRIIAFVCSVLALICLVGEFLLYWEMLDPFFPGFTSQNVIAIRPPRKEVKRRIIFNGHIDCAYEWWYNWLFGGNGVMITAGAGVIGLIVLLILQLVFYKEYKNWLSFVFMGSLPFWMALLWFTNWNVVVPGANDNLSGCLVATSVLKYLSDNKIELDHTEVQVVLTGCEESGLRGAKAWVKAHPEYLNDGIETAFFCFDTIRDMEHMAIYHKDMTGTVTHDERVSDIMRRAGEMAGVNLPYKVLFCGSTDGAAVTQGGIPASAFAAMDPAPANYYHTRRDNQFNLDPMTMGYGIDIAIGALYIFDEEGLGGPKQQQF